MTDVRVWEPGWTLGVDVKVWEVDRAVYPSSMKQIQELRVCAAIVDRPPGTVGPTNPLQQAYLVPETRSLGHVASFGNIPGHCREVIGAGNVSI